MKRWKDKKTDMLRHYCATTQMSASEIARKLRCSRNAVIGKAQRMGIALPNGSNFSSISSHVLTDAPTGRLTRISRKPGETFQIPGLSRVRFRNLAPNRCRFTVEPLYVPPSAEMLCCGAPVADPSKPFGMRKSYCSVHLDICSARAANG